MCTAPKRVKDEASQRKVEEGRADGRRRGEEESEKWVGWGLCSRRRIFPISNLDVRFQAIQRLYRTYGNAFARLAVLLGTAAASPSF